MWAEAHERETLLVEAIAQEEGGQVFLEEIMKQHRVVFVVHSEEMAQTLEPFARERNCLVSVVPGNGNYGGGKGVKGSWLVFETPE
jgi:hypothetical protein